MSLRVALSFATAIGIAVLGLGVAPARGQSAYPSSDKPSTVQVAPSTTRVVAPATVTVTPVPVIVIPAPAAAPSTVTVTPAPAVPEKTVQTETSETMVDSEGDATTTTTTTTTTTPSADAPDTNVIVTPPPAPIEPVPPAAPVATTPLPDETQVYHRGQFRPRVGAGLLLGGGFFGFSRDTARGGTDNGGYWNVRAVMGTRQFLGLEAAYVGSAQPINVLGLSNNASLIGNGAEGALRVNIPIMGRRSLVEPFAFAGLGWSRYNVVNTTTASAAISNNDDVLTVPYGGGLAIGYNGFFADARFTYRSVFYNDLIRRPDGSGAPLDNWSAGGQLGFEF